MRREQANRRCRAAPRTLAVVVATLLPSLASAWIYPEHRDIATDAITRLSPTDRATLEQLWKDARVGYAGQLCEPLSAGDQGLAPACIDFAAFPALAGDHSCSPAQVLDEVLPSRWIIDVARVSAETKAALAASTGREERLQAAATNNLKLQVADPEYASRAGANNAHFHLPRTGDDVVEYVRTCVAEGTPLNALGLYAQYHIAALALAQRLASGRSRPPIGPRQPATSSRSRASPSTGSRTSSPPATASARGAAPPGGREPTTTTTSSASTPWTGRAGRSSPSATPT